MGTTPDTTTHTCAQVFHPVAYKGHTDDVEGGSWSAPYYHPRGHVLGNNMTMCWNENQNPVSGSFIAKVNEKLS